MTKRFLTAVVLATACAISQSAIAAPPEAIYLGVIEPAKHYKFGENLPFVLRVAFKSINGHWLAMPCRVHNENSLLRNRNVYPAKASWTVSLFGKVLGKFNSKNAHHWHRFGDIGIAEPVGKSNIPELATEAKNFQYSWHGKTSRRPLAATTGGAVPDPDGWKRLTKLTPEQREKYVAKNGDTLACIKMGDGYSWFYVREKIAVLIGEPSAELIDIGDFDHDGHSEILFHKHANNLDAYLLYSQRAEKCTRYEWLYH